MTTHWIWANEPTADDEAMIYGTPRAVEALDLEFNNGLLVTTKVPPIEVVQDDDSQGVLTDNLIASGTNGLLFSTRLRDLLQKIGIDNIQYFPAVVRNPVEKTSTKDYSIANIIGRVACIDRKSSELEMSPDDPDRIEFIESLAIDEKKARGLDLFRLDEKTEIIVLSDRVKKACEKAKITGVRFYPPKDFTF